MMVVTPVRVARPVGAQRSATTVVLLLLLLLLCVPRSSAFGARFRFDRFRFHHRTHRGVAVIRGRGDEVDDHHRQRGGRLRDHKAGVDECMQNAADGGCPEQEDREARRWSG
uniref:Putative secreted protein n=1 Tax=Anopheles darlingi TaxID=43151 RepID=A0A2M4D134_ANODA